MRTACLRGEKSEKRVKNFSSYPKTKQQTRKVSLGFLGTESAKQEVGQGVRAVRCVRDQANKTKKNRSLCKHWAKNVCNVHTDNGIFHTNRIDCYANNIQRLSNLIDFFF